VSGFGNRAHEKKGRKKSETATKNKKMKNRIIILNDETFKNSNNK